MVLKLIPSISWEISSIRLGIWKLGGCRYGGKAFQYSCQKRKKTQLPQTKTNQPTKKESNKGWPQLQSPISFPSWNGKACANTDGQLPRVQLIQINTGFNTQRQSQRKEKLCWMSSHLFPSSPSLQLRARGASLRILAHSDRIPWWWWRPTNREEVPNLQSSTCLQK